MANPNAPQPPDGRPEPDVSDPLDGRDLSALPTFLRPKSGDPAAGPPQSAEEALDAVVEPWLPPEPLRPVLADAPDPAGLPMVAALSPRRLLQIVAAVAIVWGVVSFGRQVASASAASAHEDALRGANAALQAQVSAMQGELTLIQEQRYIDQQARAYRLGTSQEIPFALEAGAPALPADAPGSAAQRLGAEPTSGGPLDHWLEILFGSG